MLRFNVFFLRIICWSSSFMCELCWAKFQLILSILGWSWGDWGGVPWKVLKRELWKNTAGKPARVKCALCCANFDIAISAETLNELASPRRFFLPPITDNLTIPFQSLMKIWKLLWPNRQGGISEVSPSVLKKKKSEVQRKFLCPKYVLWKSSTRIFFLSWTYFFQEVAVVPSNYQNWAKK